MEYTQDFYAQKARKEGYAARSVYKLEEIHHKHLHHLHKAKRILDLGAAPGSWTQYLQKQLSATAEILAIDLNPLTASLSPTPKVVQLHTDFSTPDIIEHLSQQKFDFVLSDAAPLTTGNRSLDTARSEQLVECIAYIAQHVLETEGVMVAKLFQGSGMQELLAQLRKDFSKVVCMRPKAVKSSSFETYLICNAARNC